jgi:3-dehydroquinate dehydratase-1
MNDKYCLPIIKSTLQEVSEQIALHDGNYKWFEIWLDYLDGADQEFVNELESTHAGRLVYVFRRLGLEPMRLSAERRFAILRALDGSRSHVDLDANSQREEFDLVVREKLLLRVIGSYHNYHETPNTGELERVAAEIAAMGVEIVKLAALCRSPEDALRLLELQSKLRGKGTKHIVLGMGRDGLVTRIFGPIWGNALIFAPESAGEATAPGELTRGQLDAIFQNLLES